MVDTKANYAVRSENFLSRGKRCSAVYYEQLNRSNPISVIVMAHGFAARMDFGLHPFAGKFAKAGFAVFMFDYRGFGNSEGEERLLVNPYMHLQDWRAALDHVKNKEEVDQKKIALWGSSFSGGHVLTIASEYPDIAAVSAQVPFLDGISTAMQSSFLDQLKMTFAAVCDVLRKLTFRSPHYLPVVGKMGSLACMNKEDSYDGFSSLIPESEQSNWENKCPARIGLLFPFYRPISKLTKVQSPCLLISAKKDSLFSKTSIYRARHKLKNASLLELECGHFDPYKGKWFDRSIEAQLDFFVKHL